MCLEKKIFCIHNPRNWSESNSWIYFYIKTEKNYWSEQSFTGLGPEVRCTSWGLNFCIVWHQKGLKRVINKSIEWKAKYYLPLENISPSEDNVHCTDQLQENTCIIKRLRACWLLTVQRRIIPVYGGMVFNATFNNISVIGGGNRSTRINHRPATSHWQTLSHNVVLEYTSPWAGFELTKLVVINIDALDGYKSMRSRPWRLLFLYYIQDDKFINVKYTTR